MSAQPPPPVPIKADLRTGQHVYGAVARVTSSGLHVDFLMWRGFVPLFEAGVNGPDQLRGTFRVRDEVEAWVESVDGHGRITLTMIEPGVPHGQSKRNRPYSPLLRGTRLGEGVPFFELYMQRRNKRSWSRGD